MRVEALSHPSFRLYLFGGFFGLMGVWQLRVGLAWLAWSLSGSAAWTGAVAFLSFAPTLVSGPLFGVVADRIDPRRGMIATQTIQAALAALLAALSVAGGLTLWAVCAAALAVGAAASAYHPMRMTLAPRLVPRAALAQAVAMTSVNFNLTRILGPALGGWLIATQGIEASLLLSTLLFAPQAVTLALLPPQPPAPGAPGPGLMEGLREGARFAWSRGTIREAFLVTGLFSLAGRGAMELLPVAADGLYQKGAAGLGALTAAAGAGAICSSLWLARGGADVARMRRRAMLGAWAGLALAAALALIESWPAALLTVAGLGFCGTVVGVSNQSVAQTETPDGARGRVMSLWIFVAIGGTALGAAGLGALADLLGFRTALVCAAAVTAAPLPLLLRRPLAGR